jgi:hypothetical protein
MLINFNIGMEPEIIGVVNLMLTSRTEECDLCNAGVFYCGPPALTKELRQLGSDFSHNTTTKYDFHKENF